VGHPAVEERLDLPGAEPVAHLLQPIRVVAGREPACQLGNADALLAGLLLGPLVAVDPHLGRPGEGAAQLDEPGAELLVPDVEVVAADPPVGLLESIPGRAQLPIATTVVIATEDPLELLRHPDRDHPACPAACAASR
jgi:hypothetical protein